jgi:hypothetical protein
MGRKEGADSSQRISDLRVTLDSIVDAQYSEESVIKPGTEVNVTPVSLSVINESGLGDSLVFSIAEEIESSGLSCDFRIEHIKDPYDEYIDNMDKIFYPGKMSLISTSGDFCFEKCLSIAVSGLPSRPVMFSLFNDGDSVDSNHVKRIRDYVLGGNKFFALIPENESNTGITIATDFYHEAFKANPNDTLMNSIDKFSQEEQCEEMIKSLQEIS